MKVLDLSSISSLSSGVGWLCQVLGIYIAFVSAVLVGFGVVWGVDMVPARFVAVWKRANSVVTPAASFQPSAERKRLRRGC